MYLEDLKNAPIEDENDFTTRKTKPTELLSTAENGSFVGW